mgnify:CR=1 FL=1
MRKEKSTVIGITATCCNCDWFETEREIAKKEAEKHVKKYKHNVWIEITSQQKYCIGEVSDGRE